MTSPAARLTHRRWHPARSSSAATSIAASSYGAAAPLAIPRVSTVTDLVRALGWLDADALPKARRRRPGELARFHDDDYIAALQRAEAEQRVAPETSPSLQYRLQRQPALPRDLLAAGDRLRRQPPGRRALLAGARRRGDLQPGRRHASRAARPRLRLLLPQRPRPRYAAPARRRRAARSSMSTSTRIIATASPMPSPPMTGASSAVRSRGGALALHRRARPSEGCGNLFNLPVPAGFNDGEMDAVRRGADRCRSASALRHRVVVVQCGADALADDPLSRLALSNGALWRALAAIAGLAPAAAGAGRRRLQSLVGGALLGGQLGGAQRLRDPRSLPPPARRCCAASAGRAAPAATRRNIGSPRSPTAPRARPLRGRCRMRMAHLPPVSALPAASPRPYEMPPRYPPPRLLFSLLLPSVLAAAPLPRAQLADLRANPS